MICVLPTRWMHGKRWKSSAENADVNSRGRSIHRFLYDRIWSTRPISMNIHKKENIKTTYFIGWLSSISVSSFTSSSRKNTILMLLILMHSCSRWDYRAIEIPQSPHRCSLRSIYNKGSYIASTGVIENPRASIAYIEKDPCVGSQASLPPTFHPTGAPSQYLRRSRLARERHVDSERVCPIQTQSSWRMFENPPAFGLCNQFWCWTGLRWYRFCQGGSISKLEKW